ncbi:hypothetical protein SMA5143A_8204 [Streptomyces sp. MA5143a]|nr:hypothetical protein SMA5143A_8204 [Streptomyces sp. MA5143a]
MRGLVRIPRRQNRGADAAGVRQGKGSWRCRTPDTALIALTDNPGVHTGRPSR